MIQSDRFDEMMVESRFRRILKVSFPAVTAECDQVAAIETLIRSKTRRSR